MSGEGKDGWNNTKSDPDSLTSPVKMLWLEMFTAEHGIVIGSKTLSFKSDFPFSSLVTGFGKP
jgi:hypothetical protein